MVQTCCDFVSAAQTSRTRRGRVQIEVQQGQLACKRNSLPTVWVHFITFRKEIQWCDLPEWTSEPWKEGRRQRILTVQGYSQRRQKHYTSDTCPQGNSAGRNVWVQKCPDSRRLTKKDMKMRLMPIPIMIVLRAGTYHGIAEYWPVQPNQKIPTTSKGPPIIAPYRRSSGGGEPFHFKINCGKCAVVLQFIIDPKVVPMPIPIKTRPFWATVNPRFSMKTMGKACSTEEGWAYLQIGFLDTHKHREVHKQ